MTPPEYRTQVKRWFVEIGTCDGNGMDHWIETLESVEVAGEDESRALQDSWLASGKLRKMHWGELRPQTSYGLFRIRHVWEDVDSSAVAVRHSFDGHGWLYLDAGSGSDWMKRGMAYPDAEMLYEKGASK